ncbi:MAG: ABC transporter substrate-binding protein [Acidimicrobiia bacterium]
MGNNIDRRAFLKMSGMLGAAAAVAACAPAATTTTVATGGATAATTGTTGATGTTSSAALKTLRFAMSGAATSADTADPAFNNTSHDGRLISATYEQLAQFDEALGAIPVLAESWEPDDSGSVWTFKLRPGVAWHNGDQLTAADVVYSYQRLLDPAVASPGAGNLSGLDPDGVEAIDDLTVRFSLQSANVDFPLATIFRQAYIVPNGATNADLAATAIGTGPYIVREFTPGETPTVFERNPNYWQQGLPKLDVLELISIPEAPSRVAALQAGQVDVIEDPPFTELAGLEQGAETTIVRQTLGNMELIAMETDEPPFDDNRVRLAMKYAMDRQGMLDLVNGGYGTLVNDIPISAALQYGVPGVRERDLEMARQLLAEAGYGDGLDVSLKVSDVQARFVDFATVYQQQAAEAGINIELDIRPADTYWDTVWLKEPMYVSAYIARPADGMLALLYASDAAWNEIHWFRPEWDELLATARATLDVGERTSLYQQAQQMIIDEGGHLVPYMTNTIDAVRRSVRGWVPSGTPFHNFLNMDITA